MGIRCIAGVATAFIGGFLILAVSAARAQKAGPTASAAHSITVPTSSGHRVAASRSTSSSAVRTRPTNTPGNQTHTSPHRAELSGLGVNPRYNCPFSNPISCDLPVNTLIDPVTQLEVAQAVGIGRRHRGTGGSGAYILGGGYYVPAGSDDDQGAAQPAADATESTDAQQDPQQQEQQQAEQNAEQSGAYAEQSSTDIPDEGQFTLVLNDGRQIQAVAFSHSKDKIIYITPEGSRASLAFSDLDADSTVRVNQERGTPLQLPL
jgi:hypothetical protein